MSQANKVPDTVDGDTAGVDSSSINFSPATRSLGEQQLPMTGGANLESSSGTQGVRNVDTSDGINTGYDECAETQSRFSSSSSDEESVESNPVGPDSNETDTKYPDEVREGPTEQDPVLDRLLDDLTEMRIEIERSRWIANHPEREQKSQNDYSEAPKPFRESRLRKVRSVDDISPETSPTPQEEESDPEDKWYNFDAVYDENGDEIDSGHSLDVIDAGVDQGDSQAPRSSDRDADSAADDVNWLGSRPPPQDVGSIEEETTSPNDSPTTPTSANALETVTGMSIEEGRTKLTELFNYAKNFVSNQPEALETKRQLLKYGQYFLKYGQFADSINSNQEAQDNSEIAVLWASAFAHCYRAERDEYARRAEKYEGYAREWKKWSEHHQASFEEIRPLAMKEQERLERLELGTKSVASQTYLTGGSSSDLDKLTYHPHAPSADATSPDVAASPDAADWNEADESEEQIALLKFEKGNLQLKVDQVQRDNQALTSERTGLQESIEQLQEALNETNGAYERLNREKLGLSELLLELQANDKLRENRLQELEQSLVESQMAHGQLLKELDRRDLDADLLAEKDHEIEGYQDSLSKTRDENEKLYQEKYDLFEDQKHLKAQIEQLEDQLQKEREERQRRDVSPGRTPVTPRFPASPIGAGGLLLPLPLPSARGPTTPTSPLGSSFSYLEKPAHWLERESRIRNTEEFRKNRDAVLKRLNEEEAEKQRQRELERGMQLPKVAVVG